MESIAGVDNTPQSLLMIAGNNVHALYDFLLNYRLVSSIYLLMKIMNLKYIIYDMTISNFFVGLLPDPFTPL